MIEDQDVTIAVSALAELERMHEHFAQFIASSPKIANGRGVISADAGKIEAVALGITCRVVRRPVVVNGRFVASEYAFLSKHEEKDICLMRIYLSGNGILYKDANATSQLCDYNNTYLPGILINELARTLMASPIFAPGD